MNQIINGPLNENEFPSLNQKKKTKKKKDYSLIIPQNDQTYDPTEPTNDDIKINNTIPVKINNTIPVKINKPLQNIRPPPIIHNIINNQIINNPIKNYYTHPQNNANPPNQINNIQNSNINFTIKPNLKKKKSNQK